MPHRLFHHLLPVLPPPLTHPPTVHPLPQPTRQVASGLQAGTTYVRHYELSAGPDSVSVELVPGRLPGSAWRLAVSCNGVRVGPGARALPGGARVVFAQSDAAARQAGLVVVQTAGSRVAVKQDWLPGPAPAQLANYLSLDVAVSGQLPEPLTGLLAPSYRAATARAQPAGALPAVTAPPANATLALAASGTGA